MEARVKGSDLQVLRLGLKYTTQEEFAKALGCSQQSVSWAEKQPGLSGAYQRRIYGKLIRAFTDPQQQSIIRHALDSTGLSGIEVVGLSRDAILRASRHEPPADSPEAEMESGSLPWASNFRTRCLIDR